MLNTQRVSRDQALSTTTQVVQLHESRQKWRADQLQGGLHALLKALPVVEVIANVCEPTAGSTRPRLDCFKNGIDTEGHDKRKAVR